MGANGGAVDNLDVAFMRDGDGVHQPILHTGLPPSDEAVKAEGAQAVALGQVAPLCPLAQHPEDAIQDVAIIDAGHASRFVGQERFDHAPLESIRSYRLMTTLD